MKSLTKIHIQYVIGILWGVYFLYLIVFNQLLLFPKDSLELLLPAVLQIILFSVCIKLFDNNYTMIVKLMSIIFCGLIIFWQLSLILFMATSLFVGVFEGVTIVAILAVYVISKIHKELKLSVLKKLGLLLLLNFLNFVIGIFSFFIFHYWI